MKRIQLFLYFFTAPLLIYSQVNQIDSVVVWHCRDNTISHSVEVDSFDVNGLKINSTWSADDSIRTPWSQKLYTYSPTSKLINLTGKDYYNPIWIKNREQNWQYDTDDILRAQVGNWEEIRDQADALR